MSRTLSSLAVIVVVGCSSSEPPSGPEPLQCDEGLELFEGRCVDPAAPLRAR